MLINAHTAISTSKILLVPYESHHVTTYHEWMKDPEIQEATASEPLSLEEEHAMQQSWRNDHDKLTFIACLPLSSEQIAETCDSHGAREGAKCKLVGGYAGSGDVPERMVGDVNLFLSLDEEDESLVNGELELMIASPSQRRQGLGRAAILIFLRYFQSERTQILLEFASKERVQKCGLGKLKVKIGKGNEKSIGLFESIGFVKVRGEANYFGELELVFEGDLGERVDGMVERWGFEGYRTLRYEKGDD